MRPTYVLFSAGGFAAGKGCRAEGLGVLVGERRRRHGILLRGATIYKQFFATLEGSVESRINYPVGLSIPLIQPGTTAVASIYCLNTRRSGGDLLLRKTTVVSE